MSSEEKKLSEREEVEECEVCGRPVAGCPESKIGKRACNLCGQMEEEWCGDVEDGAKEYFCSTCSRIPETCRDEQAIFGTCDCSPGTHPDIERNAFDDWPVPEWAGG